MKKTFLIVAFILLLWIPLHAASQLSVTAGNHLWLTGTSTLHPYASTSTPTQIVAVLAPGNGVEATAPVPMYLVDIAHRAPFEKFEVVIPVKGLKSGESGLDKNMYKALKSEQAPEIQYTLTHYEALASTAADVSIPFKAAGQLSIAGVQKEITMSGIGRVEAEELAVDGQYTLLMSDYGIRPPKLLMGAIKVGDSVVIHFHLKFKLNKGEIQ